MERTNSLSRKKRSVFWKEGFLLSGKSLDSEGNNDGFLVKIGSPLPTGSVYLEEGGENTYAWSTPFGTAGRKDAANAAAIVNDDVFVVGIATLEGQQTHATLRKYDLASGNELWSSIFPPSDQGLESAFESIQVTSDGGAILNLIFSSTNWYNIPSGSWF